GAYLEGAARGRELFQVAREITRSKPIVVWKGGATTAGAETSASHTGSLAASATVWSAAMKQAGVAQVHGMEELADTIMAFQSLGPALGNRVALITGLAAGGGGDSVTGADICHHHGLQVPQFAPHTLARLDTLLGRLGSILRNPVDAAQRRESPEVLAEVLAAVAADPNIDLILVEEHMGIMVEFHPPELIHAINDVFAGLKRQGGKPLAMILTHGLAEEARRDAERRFMENGVPVFASINSAARALGHLTAYNRYRKPL
ncbi:MAG: hypothetical protein QGH23_00880, partial [Dehalococcoidia bacterium]|nr:hypothetical protein [Dehalococcoidia bacterium]